MDYETTLRLLEFVPLVFVTVWGACVGSLINVLNYRLPLGLDVVTPTSRCTHCDTKLSFKENIPVLGWLLLRGRCRFCRGTISSEYIKVEALVALMFAGLWVMFYMIPSPTVINLGLFELPLHTITPDWARVGVGMGVGGWQLTWPYYAMVAGLFSCLLSMTIIDARTFTIPMALTIATAVIGLVGHMGQWAYLQVMDRAGLASASGWLWSIPTPMNFSNPDAKGPGDLLFTGWWWVGASVGATVGLGVGMLLLKYRVIRRSFDEYPAWEAQQLEAQQAAAAQQADQPQSQKTGQQTGEQTGELDDPTVLWTAYPHARREMVREMAFLAPAALLGAVGGWVAIVLAFTPEPIDPSGNAVGESIFLGAAVPPLWLVVLTGVLMGFLIGGGLVWAIRILGTLAFGKEAMGLGDVHLMAGVGACLGWIDATLAFFLSAFVAMLGTVIMAVGRGKVRKTLPYGPWLALATVLVFVLKPAAEWGISRLIGAEVPIKLP
jgi:leader peptidase (prepilin peptidase)/N-methyltransferase